MGWMAYVKAFSQRLLVERIRALLSGYVSGGDRPED
jgi:hypothetical protein